MRHLIHLNGPPGIGKSTLARRYVADHPGTLNCDIDVLRSFEGGWEEDFEAAGALIRPAALALIEAYLEHSGDVVLPQMLVDRDEVALFESCAERAGATFTEIVLMDELDSCIARFARRGSEDAGDAVDPWHEQVRAIVEARGGDTELARWHAAVSELVEGRPDARVVTSVADAIEETYASMVRNLT